MSPFPFESLSLGQRELGLVVGVVIGFAFGFVLERAGFGRAQKLVGQFYGHDMTVFKVMFSAIVTAMLGMVVLDGVGLVDLRAVSGVATSTTFLWPMVVGGFALGAGFIVSGYCPGTSAVAMASGKVDGAVTLGGVVLGSVLYAELQPALGGFHGSGDLGHLYLYDLLGVPPAVAAAGVVGVAVLCFLGAERLERALAKAPAPGPARRRPGRLAWAGMGLVAAVGLATLFVPVRSAAGVRGAEPISAEALARRVLEEPWTLRILDVRATAACAEQRVPGAGCVPAAELGTLGLAEASPARDLVLVGDTDVAALPDGARAYRGRVLQLAGGFEAWRRYVLAPPEPPAPAASGAEREAYRLRSGLHAAMTGVKQAPPPPAPTLQAAPPRKKGEGGGCGG